MKYRSQWPTFILRSNTGSYCLIIPKYGVHISNSLQDIRQNHWTMKYRSQWPTFILRPNVVSLCLSRTFRSNKLNCNTTEIPFQTETWPSPSQLTLMTVDNVKSFTQALIYTSSDIHGIQKSICTSIHIIKNIYLTFSIENWMLQRCLRRNSEVFTAFYNIHIVK